MVALSRLFALPPLETFKDSEARCRRSQTQKTHSYAYKNNRKLGSGSLEWRAFATDLRWHKASIVSHEDQSASNYKWSHRTTIMIRTKTNPSLILIFESPSEEERGLTQRRHVMLANPVAKAVE